MSGSYRGRGGSRSYGGQRSYARNGSSRSERSGSRRPRIGVLVLALVVLVGIGAGVSYLLKGFATGNPGGSAAPGNNEQLNSDKFYDGVFVDDIPLGGLTRDEAKQQVQDKQKAFAQTAGVTVASPDGGTKTLLKISDLPSGAYSYDTDAVLDEAYKAGRDGATSADNLAAIQQLPANPVKLATTITFSDLTAFEQKVRAMTAPYYQAPMDAAYIPGQFDATQQGVDRLSFTDEKPGQQVDPDALWAAVKAEFDNGTFGTVQMTLEPVQPAVTKAMIQADMQLYQIASIQGVTAADTKLVNTANAGHTYTTHILDHSTGRLANIKLAGDAVSGLVLPGQEFDFNALTGNRTAAQGYQLAPVDVSGIVDKGLGGGVCQVSGTLYNAVVRYGGKYEADGNPSTLGTPGLAVTARDSHSVQSAYLQTGTDATVDVASGKDLKFRNDFDKPVLVVMYYDHDAKWNYFEHCDIYGPPLPDGATFDLVRKNGHTISLDPSTPPETHFSKYAEPGNPVLKDGHNGYQVDVYIQKTVNGVQTLSNKIYTNTYNPQPPYYYVYLGETVPPATPTPSPEPTGEEPTPTPTDATPTQSQ